MNDQIPSQVLALIAQLADLNRVLADHARDMCGRTLDRREDNNLMAMLNIRRSLLLQLESLGYKVADGSNVWRRAPDDGLAAALGMIFG